MYQPRRLKRILSIILCLLFHAQGADKYTDENRPYEFGFKIDGEQHRHEKKDKDGIIMGEFGFITADDVYHVTVYATDKEGRFKILSMKNIHLKSSSGGSTTSARRGHSLPLPPTVPLPNKPIPPQTAHVNQAPKSIESVNLEPPGKACSSCSLPTTTMKAPIQQNYAQERGGQSPFAQQNVYAGHNYPEEGSEPPQNTPHQNKQLKYSGAQNYAPEPEFGRPNVPPQPANVDKTQINFQSSRGLSDRNPKQYNVPEQRFDSNIGSKYPQSQQLFTPPKPTLISAQMQIVDKNTDIHHLNPGEMHGLPPGLTKHDMIRLLYTFNYTLGFQGHFEEGYNTGVKKGYYFVTGRNGVRMRIDYVADDTGFHPKLSQDVLDVSSEDVPKPETEKDEKYGLKGYEFKWLYYPVDSKKR